MSITTHQQLSYLTPLYNKNPFTIESSYVEEENFYYLFYIIDTDGNVVSTRQSKSPDDLAIFDPNSICKNKVSYNFHPTITGNTDNSNLFYQYKVSYGSISDGDYDTPATSNIVNGFPFNFQLDDTDEITDYFLTSSTKKFLTSFHNTDIVVTKNDYYTFNLLNGNFGALGTSNPYRYRYTFVKNDGSSEQKTLLDTSSYPTISTSSFYSNLQYVVQSIPVGPANLLNTTFDGSSTLASDYFDDVDYYTVKAESSGSAALSQTYTFKLKCVAHHTNYQIFFLNKYSGWDSITFNHGNYTTYQSKSETFRKDPWVVSGNEYVYQQGNRGLETLNKKLTKVLTVYTDLLKEDYFEILQEFFNSPYHILYKDGKEIPLILDTNKIKIEDKMNRNIYQVKLDFEYSVKTKTTL